MAVFTEKDKTANFFYVRHVVTTDDYLVCSVVHVTMIK